MTYLELLRRTREMTQSDLAFASGLSIFTISAFELKKREPGAGSTALLQREFGPDWTAGLFATEVPCPTSQEAKRAAQDAKGD